MCVLCVWCKCVLNITTNRSPVFFEKICIVIPFLTLNTEGEAPTVEILLKRGKKKTVQTYLARCQTAGAGLKRPKEKQNRTKQEALHKEEKQLVWPHQEISESEV